MRLGALQSSGGGLWTQKTSRSPACRPSCTGRALNVQGRLGVVRVGQAETEEQQVPDEDEDYQLRSDLKSVARSMLEGKPLLREDEAEVREEMERERFFGRIAVLGLGVRTAAVYIRSHTPCTCMRLMAASRCPPSSVVHCHCCGAGNAAGGADNWQGGGASAGSCSRRAPVGDRAAAGCPGEHSGRHAPPPMLHHSTACGLPCTKKGCTEAYILLQTSCVEVTPRYLTLSTRLLTCRW